MNYTPNPFWADKVLEKINPLIKEKLGKVFAVDERRIVEEGAEGTGQQKFKEYGCGYYGCVFPTNKKKVVLKLTVDRSELAIPMATQFDRAEVLGTIRYYHVLNSGLVTETEYHKSLPLYLIWRDEVWHNSFLTYMNLELEDEFGKSAFRDLNNMVIKYNRTAGALFRSKQKLRMVGSSVYEEEDRMFGRVVELIRELTYSDLGYSIGAAIAHYLFTYNLLLTDVHFENIALKKGCPKVVANDECLNELVFDPDNYVLFDTGLTMPVSDDAKKYFKMKVPRLTDM